MKIPKILGYSEEGCVYRNNITITRKQAEDFYDYIKNSYINYEDCIYLLKHLEAFKTEKFIYSNTTTRNYLYKFLKRKMTERENYNTIIKIKN
jgi:hypothetical protein